MTGKFLSTADMLGSFRKELIEQGFNTDEAFDMAREAARTLVGNDGLAVHND